MHVCVGDTRVDIQTPAKLNLFLEVLKRRDDGYHEILTLMAPITIFDTLHFTARTDGTIDFSCDWVDGFRARKQGRDNPWDQLPNGVDNLVVQTLEMMRVASATRLGASVRLTKQIPAAAGLGGASSNAAAALVAGNIGWGLNWSHGELRELAAEIGSDVPFFLVGDAAICRGRGEQLEEIGGIGRFHFVVVKPPAGLSTPDVYKRCQPAERPNNVKSVLAAAMTGDAIRLGDCLFNRLQPAAELLSPWIARLRAIFDRLDVLGHQMSGSGTSYFGICRHARHARRVASRLRAANVGAVFYATTLPNASCDARDSAW